ncbi:MAG: hypothetical protein GDA48_03800 [Hormoscilla sp. GM102CHS1]|nr:hypothetical protein [Hormoscilla sp. GM102CHS1]
MKIARTGLPVLRDRAAIMGVKVWSEQKPVDTRDKIIRELNVRCGKTVKEVSELKYDWEQAANVAMHFNVSAR